MRKPFWSLSLLMKRSMTLILGRGFWKKTPLNKVIVGHLNINSLKNKFEALQYVINRNLDILLLETKLDDSFPSAQFILKGYGIPNRLTLCSWGYTLQVPESKIWL